MPVNNAGQGAGMCFSFGNPLPSFLNDPTAIVESRGVNFYTTQWHPWGLSNIKINEIRTAGLYNYFGIGVGMISLSHSLYKEHTIYFSFAKKLSKRASAGLTVFKQNLWIQDYGSKSNKNFSIAIKNSFTNSFAWGLSLISFGKRNANIRDRIFHYGMINALRFVHQKTSIQFEIKHGSYLSSGLSLNISYRPVSWIDIGFTSMDRSRQTILSGVINVENFHITLSGVHSMYLAKYTYQVGIGFSFDAHSTSGRSSARKHRSGY